MMAIHAGCVSLSLWPTKKQWRALAQDGQAGGRSAVQDSSRDLSEGLRHQVDHENLGLAGCYQPAVTLEPPHTPCVSATAC